MQLTDQEKKNRENFTRKQYFFKFLGSTIALVFGWLIVVAGVSAVARNAETGVPPASPFMLYAGIMILLGTYAYRSKKKRQLGMLENSQVRIGAEAIIIGLVIFGFVFQRDFLEVIVEDPFTRLFIPVFSVVPYFILFRNRPKEAKRCNMKKSTFFFVITTLFIICAIPVLADKKVLNEEDANYMLNSFKINDQGIAINSQPPKNEKQKILHDAMQAVSALEKSYAQKVEAIGPIEFNTTDELEDLKKIIYYRRNLLDYRKIKENYYNDKGELLIKFNKELGIKTRPDGRDQSSVTYQMEYLEYEYLENLEIYYDFIISNHDEIQFLNGKVYIENDDTIMGYNDRFNKLADSSSKLVAYQDGSKKVMIEGLTTAKQKK
jgi:hypothetical protein